MRLLSSDEMKQVEQYTAKYGLSYQRMMENAGAACARNIRNIVENENVSRRNAVIVCGKGNNGGDDQETRFPQRCRRCDTEE